jgi:lipid-A-disaccharide synthase
VRILISAGEASGDLYASRVVESLRARHPDAEFFGCAGPRMQAAGVRPVVDASSLSVVGLVEVLAHIPRIWGEFRKLVRAAAVEKPDVAVLTDSSGFHLRVARRLKTLGIPVVYLIAPQAWAWRGWRVRTMRQTIQRLLCIFPFEQEFFETRGVPTTYIGHPLARIVRPSMTETEFRGRYQLSDQPIVTLLPGSRRGEVERHMPILLDAVERIGPGYAYVLALPAGFGVERCTFWERIQGSSIKVIEGSTWDALAFGEVALAASGTVTIEAALLGIPMVTFYRVNALSWLLGRRLVHAPFFSMVNLVAGRRIVPELIQDQMTGKKIAAEAVRLLEDAEARDAMRTELGGVARKLASDRDPMEIAADWIEKVWSESKETVHAV